MGSIETPVDSSSTTRSTAPGAPPTAAGIVDSGHPYYLHPSDYPGMNLVSSVFDGKAYGGWRRAIVIALSAKNKLGFIDGTLVVPEADSGLKKAWARSNDMVLSWLLNSLSKEIAESVLYSQSAKDLWSDLEDRFGQTNGAKLFQLQKELSGVIQGNISVSTYFTKMKSLWDELDALNTFSACVCECECGAKAKSHKAHQDERLLMFLMGLNDTFIGVRSNILLSSPLPSIGQAYSLVIQDEKQREIHATPAYPGESASFMINNQTANTNQGTSFKRVRDNRGQKGFLNSKKPTAICAYCKKPGHTIDQCYRIHGFPSDFKFTNQRKFQGQVQASNVFRSNEEVVQTGNTPENAQTLTQENVAELLQVLQQIKLGQLNASSPEPSANLSCAGPFTEEPYGDW